MVWDHGGSNSYRMGAEDRYDLQLGDTTQQRESEEEGQGSVEPPHTLESGPTASGGTLSSAVEQSGSAQPTSNPQPPGAVGGLSVPHLSTEGEGDDGGEGEGEGETDEREEYLDRVESRLRRLGMKFAMDTDEEDEEVSSSP